MQETGKCLNRGNSKLGLIKWLFPIGSAASYCPSLLGRFRDEGGKLPFYPVRNDSATSTPLLLQEMVLICRSPLEAFVRD